MAGWCNGTALLHSAKPELRIYAGPEPARGVSEIHNGEDLWQCSQLANHLSSVNHTTKTIHHHHLHHRLNLDKALLLPRNQTICLKNWNFWRASTATKFNIFCWNFARVSYLTMSTKGCSGFFCFVNKFNKNLKNECVETRSFLFLKITQDLNKIINIPNTLL